jgi:hypothetical protein
MTIKVSSKMLIHKIGTLHDHACGTLARRSSLMMINDPRLKRTPHVEIDDAVTGERLRSMRYECVSPVDSNIELAHDTWPS